ncbi:MAG: tRNA (N(6)-L-threonylcarbamoyladenosine(37)-C(2))-methylthiotransferase MtaB, partial [Xanthobacteraceae bacterium]
PATRMPQVPRATIKQRAQRLREKGAIALRRHLETQVGARAPVLIESGATGRTEHFTPVRLGRAREPGMIVNLTMVGHDGRQLLAA